MGRANRLMERRALRRAADQALLTSMGTAAASRPGAAPDQDFDYKMSEPTAPADTGASYDHEPVTEPIPVPEVDDLVPDRPDHPEWDYYDEMPAGNIEVAPEPVDVYDLLPDLPDDSDWGEAGDVPADDDAFPSAVAEARDPLPEQPDHHGWDHYDEAPQAPVAVRPLRARPLAEAAALVHPAVDIPMPQYRPQPWYRTKPVGTVLTAAVVVAVLCGGWLALRNPTTTAEQSSTVAPTSGPPPPSKTQPTAVSAPEPAPAPPPTPPPPPPPPPTAEPVYSAPQRQYSEPWRSAPPPAEKPRVDVTRAPISVAPVPKPVHGSDSSTPGDAPGEKPRRRGCFGFC